MAEFIPVFLVVLLLREAGGGIAYGAALGGPGYFMLKRVDSYQEDVLITLAAVIGGHALAHVLGVSGPLAMVAAGILIVVVLSVLVQGLSVERLVRRVVSCAT